jgi:RNA polymerase sigma-70 factor (ECF subfamily)
METSATATPNDSFRDLMRRVREGSDEAAWELVDSYGEMIRRAVRRALNQRLRSKFDSLDFVQLVWSSFFRARFRFEQFDRPEELTAFLVTMARNKVGMEIRRRLLTEKYNLNREETLFGEKGEGWEEVSGHQPGPIDVAIAREQWSLMMEDQPEHYRRIIQLRLQGHTYQDIADTLQVAESTVRRFLKRLFHERVA